jgi:hypothetical protein
MRKQKPGMSANEFSNVQGLVDQQLQEQGTFSPVEFLLATGRLLYSDYEHWRRAEVGNLEAVLLGNPGRVRAQVGQAVDYARSIGLVAEEQCWVPWVAGASRKCETQEILRISADEAFHNLVCQRFFLPDEVPQLDMFFHSPTVVLANSVAEALAGRDVEGVRQQLDKLYREAPNHPELAAFDRLFETLCRCEQPVVDLAGELAGLQALAPVARQLLGGCSRDYLVPLWRRLLVPLDGRGFDVQEPLLHASYVLAQVQDWPGVSIAVRAQSAWWEHAELCRRLVESGCRRGDRVESLTAWCYLCWLHPESGLASLTEGDPPDQGIHVLWQYFLEFEDSLPLEEQVGIEDFPAWLLLHTPGLARALPTALEGDVRESQQAFHLAQRLSLANGVGDIELRRSLLDLHPALFRYFKSQL